MRKISIRAFDLDKWGEILQAITRNKVRSFLTAFGIFWGIFMLVFLMGGGQGLRQLLGETFSGISQNSFFAFAATTSKPYEGYNKGRKWNFTHDDVERLNRNITEVALTTPLQVKWDLAISHHDKAGVAQNLKGIYPEYAQVESPKMKYGRYINNTDIQQVARVCVIGTKIRDELFPGEDNPVGKYIKVDGVTYQIVGLNVRTSSISVMGPTDRSVMIPYTTYRHIYNTGRKVALIAGLYAKGVDASKMENRVKEVLYRAHSIAPDDTKACSVFCMATLIGIINNLFDGIDILVWLIGIGTLVSGAIGVSNIMMVTVRERTQEIGIRRAIGATPRNVMSQIVSESIVLTIIAGFSGISFATMLLVIVEQMANASGGTANFIVSLPLALGAAAALAILGALAGLMPAMRALNIKPIEAIRDE